jgi:phosphate ABC transporter phosphate-binding protein
MSEKVQAREGTREERVAMPHRGGNITLIILAILATVVVIVAAAFATGMLSTGSDRDAVTLTGAGATFPMPLILKWADEYHNETSGKVRVNYGGGGSGAGITQIKDRHVDFAGTDAPLSANESSTYDLVHIPETLGAVVVAYNEPSISALKLDGPTLASIFMKNITAWNDAAIAALNPGVTLPTDQITTVVRSDSSGTTFVFSGYLEAVSSEFDSLYGQGKSVNWPDAIGASGNPGVTQTVRTTAHAIGYIELAYAMQNNVPFAQLKNHDGNFVTPTLETTSAAAASASVGLPSGDGDWSHVSILDAPGANSYPIASFTYILIYKELYNDQTKMNKTAAKSLVDFLWWIVHPDGQAYASPIYYAPLPASMLAVNEVTLNSITYNGVALR